MEGKNWKKWGKKKIMTEIVATMLLPIDRLTATKFNTAAHAKIWPIYG